MRATLLILLFCCCNLITGQDTYRTEAAVITFDASTPLEDIHAVNRKVNTVIQDNGEIASLLLVREFDFKKKLMQEHFNENYIESDKYPKAYFIGKIASFDLDQITESPRTFELSGDLTMHGVTRPITASVKVNKEGEALLMETTFIVRTEDYKIKVPRLLFKKIAEEIQVEVSARLNRS
ncbi:YceI-like domain-containing protein [Muriicola jejuensis]|uniref:YceI family protein n=1 Tax=Muriicola jejuensis TaxID=504488 RepID=A0A6P0UCG9_9FLAO|nr:YceI family protein [Muriicola jejuensis]NER10971.1 YceI family protein [Muriicola jejuensis]SMP15108.1 YceI-like domain-containing protein [Muriicola jejuensis]